MTPAPSKAGSTPNSKNNESSSDGIKAIKGRNKKQKLESHLEVDMNEHEGETLVTSVESSSSRNRSANGTGRPSSSQDIADMDARRLEKLAKSNPAFYAMLQEDGVVAGDRPGLEEAMDEDEQYIRHYEKKLGIKRKDAGKLASKKSFLDDGLGDLLEGIELGSRGRALGKSTTIKTPVVPAALGSVSKSKSSSSTLSSKRKVQEIEDEDEYVTDSFDEEFEGFDSEDMESEGDEIEGIGSNDEDSFDEDSFDEELEGVDPDDMAVSEEDIAMSASGSDDEELDSANSESEDDVSDQGLEEEEEEEEEETSKGEEKDKKSETPAQAAILTGKYLPPHLRAAAAVENGASPSGKSIPRQNAEDLIRLRRQLQGLLNKLSESNVESILMDVEALYRKYPRAGKDKCLCYESVVVIAERWRC
jgi:nucleolar MIF4G domain-containing protein 1